ncbi:MAG TPA: LysR substrate-binding domain-containing protein [Planctomycetota bacterium]
MHRMLDCDPELLRTFLAVQRHLNLTRAAEELYLSQPAVSRRIERLERALGVRLLERLGKMLRLTDAGEVLAVEATTLVGALERVAETMRARRTGQRGRIRVGASSTPGLYLLPRVIRAFKRRFPDVAVDYTVENSLRIEERVVRNDLDVGFTGAHLAHASLRLQQLCEDEIVFYVAQKHPLAKRNGLRARDLEDEPCFVREPGSATRSLVDRWLQKQGARLRCATEMGCPEAARVLVRAMMGCSYGSLMALRAESTGLCRLELDGLHLVRPIYVALHADKHLSPPLQALLEMAAGSMAPLS